MRPAVRSVVARYGFALAAVLVALLARALLDPLLDDRLPFLFPCVAVVAVSWHGGFGPSVLAMALSIVLAAYLFLPPRYNLAESMPQHRVPVGGVVFLTLTIGLFSERMRAARRRAEAHAETAIRQRQALEVEVAERRRLEAELQHRNEQLAEADRRKDEFLAMLGHELRNPLAPIRNALHVLQLGAAEPQRQKAHALIERQVEALARLVDDLLEVSRITRGKIHLRPEPVELATVLSRAVESMRPMIDTHRHTLAVELLPEPTRIVGDPTRLEQVFANLLHNAAKYTERGGQIHVSEEHHGDTVIVRVRDTGFGIAATTLPRVFDLFTQSERTLDRAQGGLGIGLTLVKTLVELHGGTVEAHSDGPGQGSEFVVRLPVAPPSAEPAASAPPAAVPAPTGAARRVLVIDDNQDTAASLAMLLRLWGHEIRTANDGASGLKAAESYRPQVVLLDIGLPGMDGYELARRLRAEFGSRLLLVALTGYGQEEDRQKALRAGFNAHLVKPAAPAELKALLAGALNAG